MSLAALYGSSPAPAVAQTRAFEAASTSKRLANWSGSPSTLNSDIAQGGKILTARLSDLDKNDPLARRSTMEFVNALVGVHGIRPVANTDSKALNKRINAAWAVFANKLDARKRSVWASFLRLHARQCWIWGETPLARQLLSLREMRALGLNVPLRVKTLHPTQIDGSQLGQRTRLGVEYDADDAATAYWVRPRSDVATWQLGATRIAAEDMSLAFEELEAGQLRGVSPLTPVALTLRDTQDAADAERVRMRVAACFSTILIGEDDEEQDELGPVLSTRSDGSKVYSMSPGAVYYARGVKSVVNPKPESAGGWKDFDRSHLMRVAAGLGLSIERLTGDLSTANFSSLRIGDIAWRTNTLAFGEHTFIPQVCARVWDWFQDAATSAGVLDKAALDFAPQWLRPVWVQADAEGQANAAKSKTRLGLQSPQTMIAEETGNADWRGVIAETAEFQRECEKQGVVYDSLVAKVSGASQTQNAPPADSAGADKSAASV